MALVLDVELALGTDRSIALRLYRPHHKSGPAGLVLFLHGGGWSLGWLELSDSLCRGRTDRGLRMRGGFGRLWIGAGTSIPGRAQ